MNEGNNLYEKSYQFAVRVINGYKYLSKEKREFIISKQLLKSGTSIGANVSEANGAISKNDFSNKISLAYKESLETKYWLNLLKDTSYIDEKTFNSMHEQCDELSKILFSILENTRIKSSSDVY